MDIALMFHKAKNAGARSVAQRPQNRTSIGSASPRADVRMTPDGAGRPGAEGPSKPRATAVVRVRSDSIGGRSRRLRGTDQFWVRVSCLVLSEISANSSR